jgi:hypothetical protein
MSELNSSNNSSTPGVSYSGCGNVNKLSGYSNETSVGTTQKQINREDILNTLINGSPTPNSIKRCLELITSDKKKNE